MAPLPWPSAYLEGPWQKYGKMSLLKTFALQTFCNDFSLVSGNLSFHKFLKKTFLIKLFTNSWERKKHRTMSLLGTFALCTLFHNFSQISWIYLNKLLFYGTYLIKLFLTSWEKNPAYGRHWITRPMRIIGPIFFQAMFLEKFFHPHPGHTVLQ